MFRLAVRKARLNHHVSEIATRRLRSRISTLLRAKTNTPSDSKDLRIRLVAFDARTYEVVNDNIPVGEGAFHMWGNQVNNQIWTTNPVGMTISVVDMLTQDSLATIESPMIDGAQIEPHDIILDPTDGSAYVAFFAEGEEDFVIKYSSETFEELARTPVGKDPHVLIHEEWPFLYVAAQAGQRVEVLDPATLETAAPQIDIFNAHGVTFDPDGSRFFVSSFPQPSGEDSIHTVDPMTNEILSTIDAPVAGVGPHNLLLSRDRTKKYATHTGADSDFVSIYDVTGESPVLLEAVQGGLNPFGIAAIPAVPEPTGIGLASLAAILGMSFLRRRRS